ncbi:MAG TPA: hypothetical protein VGM19_09990 [Armatimonadota bacterium]|jgi:hypothetical protein
MEIFAALVTAVATVVLAWVTYKNIGLAKASLAEMVAAREAEFAPVMAWVGEGGPEDARMGGLRQNIFANAGKFMAVDGHLYLGFQTPADSDPWFDEVPVATFSGIEPRGEIRDEPNDWQLARLRHRDHLVGQRGERCFAALRYGDILGNTYCSVCELYNPKIDEKPQANLRWGKVGTPGCPPVPLVKALDGWDADEHWT